MSSISSVASAPALQAQQAVQRPVKDRDGDGDNDATESAAAKAKEAAKPANPNLGNNVNVTA